LVDGASISNFSRLSNHHTHGVIKKDTLTYFGCWMNFNARQKPTQVRKKSTQPPPPHTPKGMRQTVQDQGMQARITGEHLKAAFGGRIALKNTLDIVFDS
jgi:hypothetical protein